MDDKSVNAAIKRKEWLDNYLNVDAARSIIDEHYDAIMNLYEATPTFLQISIVYLSTGVLQRRIQGHMNEKSIGVRSSSLSQELLDTSLAARTCLEDGSLCICIASLLPTSQIFGTRDDAIAIHSVTRLVPKKVDNDAASNQYMSCVLVAIYTLDIHIAEGSTYVVVWKDQEHLDTWFAYVNKKGSIPDEPPRIISFASETAPAFWPDDDSDLTRICIFAGGIGTLDDFSDLNLVVRGHIGSPQSNKEETCPPEKDPDMKR